jgi:hypothetical protein
MTLRSTASCLVAFAFVAATPAFGQQTGTQTPPKPAAETKTDAKLPTLTAAGLAGKWAVTVNSQGSQIESALDIKTDAKDPKKFTGTITSQMGEAQLQGEVVDGKLTFSFAMAGGSGDLNVTFTGTQQKDSSLTGTLNFGQGEITWSAVKAK